MSGEAGATIESELYCVAIGSGVIVSVAPPPGAGGSAVADYFAREAAPYQRWLERARPALDALFARLVHEGQPIVRYAQPFEEIWGTFVEDGDPKSFAANHRGGPLIVRLAGHRHMPDYQSLNLSFLVSRRVEKRAVEPIVARVAGILGQERP